MNARTETAPVVIMAGGTGGHVFPGLAVADALRARGVPVVWLGTREGLESRLVPEAGLPLETLRVRGLRNKGVAGWLLAPVRLLRAVWQGLGILRRHRPRSVLGLGGYVAGPGGLAAWLLRRPLVVHEQNAVAGLTNRLLARLARRTLAGFPGAFPAHRAATVTGNPVRGPILRLPVDSREPYAGTRPLRLLVVGGSLGALVLNETVPEAVARIEPGDRPEIRHQAGERTLERARQGYDNTGVEAEIVPFIRDMAAAYDWADLVICRAGALTVSELAIAGLPACLVPLPHAVDDHQTANGRVLESAGAAVLLPQDAFTPTALADCLQELIRDPARLQAMAHAARSAARPDAAETVAETCLEVAR